MGGRGTLEGREQRFRYWCGKGRSSAGEACLLAGKSLQGWSSHLTPSLHLPAFLHAAMACLLCLLRRCTADMLQCVAGEGAEVMVASHNQPSIERTVAAMAALGLPPSAGVYFGQLLGMADHLTYTLGDHGYGAYK